MAKMTKEQINQKYNELRLIEEAAEKKYMKTGSFKARMALFDAQQASAKFMMNNYTRGE